MTSRHKLMGTLYLLGSATSTLTVLTILYALIETLWPATTTLAAVAMSTLVMMSIFLLWRGLSRLRTWEELYLLSHIRGMGGRTTVRQLARMARRRGKNIAAFLEERVRRGQAVVNRHEEEPLYIFDGFMDYTGKEMAFHL